MEGECKKCGTPLQPGQAIAQTWTTGVPDFPGQTDLNGQTMSPGGPGQLVGCLKCPQCGWSVTE